MSVTAPDPWAPLPGPLNGLQWVLYVAGPMRRIAQFNFPEFLWGETELLVSGYGTINPARLDLEGGFYPWDKTGWEDLGTDSMRKFLQKDLDAICERADGLALLTGWEHSSGAKAEYALAEALGIPSLPLQEWVKHPAWRYAYREGKWIEREDAS